MCICICLCICIRIGICVNIYIYIYIYIYISLARSCRVKVIIHDTPCGGEVRHGVTSGVSCETRTENDNGDEVRHGVTSGVSCKTSLNKHVAPHLYRKHDTHK